MKRHSFLQLTAAMLTGFMVWGCGDRLNVDPVQSVDEDKALQTSSDVLGAVVGCYDGYGSTEFGSGAVQYIADLLADDGDVRFAGTFATHQQFWRKTMIATNSQISLTWRNGYSTINRTNNVLENLGKLDTDAQRAAAEGEVLFIRGLSYFNLVRLFAKAWGDGDNTVNPGVPLVLTATKAPITEANSVPRNSVSAVYTQIIADLTKAEADLKNGPVTANGANAAAAAAILSRVYLMQGNYAAARDAANRVIASGLYSLEADYSKVFNDYKNRRGVPSSESIFSTLITIQDGTNSLLTYYGSSANGGRNDVRIQAKLLNEYAAYGDKVRGNFFIQDGIGRIFTAKYQDQYANVTQVRLAEMYLTRAEANFMLNTQVGATPLEDINRIRSRAGLAALTSITRSDILKERKLELIFEGEYLHDLRRTRRNISSSILYNDARLVLPIPQREIDTNTSLVQNPGY
ncbi:hypothetical protein BWI96_04565 [Siphonobacter sp. SORGH_AS_0500]|uniref:RagB/SusD family nutrient uptake outer membrane protein n=1 Tax=Siphonobacter sp. SORGH_AS_0500 TaxID=1864824 RepID=UPI000CB53EC0|nr:RagB/SusD family nutrient uptake outer membrane protein [Siphonobacter sp. SORGH_AS_0500]PKK37745.1 hypothetical protein BWI96_04565 [Siphonobacter sp. SORGH_AS_0500]